MLLRFPFPTMQITTPETRTKGIKALNALVKTNSVNILMNFLYKHLPEKYICPM